MKKVFLLGAIVCTIGIISACKGDKKESLYEREARIEEKEDSLLCRELQLQRLIYEYFATTELDSILYIFQEAKFIGGEDSLQSFLQKNIHYPKEAIDNKIEGRVYVSFIVEQDGSIKNVQVVRDIGCGCGDEAVRVVNLMPKWKPAMWQNNVVRQQYYLPIKFSLQE